MKYKVLIGWNRKAADMIEEGKAKALQTRKLNDVDWDIKEFKTAKERAAYLQGVADGNGWDRPAWTTDYE